MNACLRVISVLAGWEREVLFDVIFGPLFVAFKPEIKDTTVGTALYY